LPEREKSDENEPLMEKFENELRSLKNKHLAAKSTDRSKVQTIGYGMAGKNHQSKGIRADNSRSEDA